MDYESTFLIDRPDKIIHHLSILFKKKCLLTASFGEDNESFITTILDIDLKKNRLIFYHSPKEGSIEKLLTSPKITFKTEYLGIKIIFDALRLSKIQHQGVEAFTVPIPSSLLWMEARNFHRVKPPVTKPGYCRLIRKDQKPIDLKLYDISLGGFSILTDSRELSELMPIETGFEQCKLILPDMGEETIDFEIRSKCVIIPENAPGMEKIGCKFTRTTAAFESTVQRYMQQIERELRQKN